MFDCKQDIGLLHDSLVSVAYSNSGSLFDFSDVKDAVNIVYDSIRLIIHHSLNDVKDEKEKVKIQLHMNERLHAAILFTTLRSHGIKSEAADDFYESILYNWPIMDLKFYIELNFKCDWSEYFIKCALQLPTEILYKVLNMVLDISFPSYIEYYSWHLIVQTLMLKLLKVPHENEGKYPFDFDFATKSVENQSNNETAEKCNNDAKKNYDTSGNDIKITDQCKEISDKWFEITENNEVNENKTELIENDCGIPEKQNEESQKNSEVTEKDVDLLSSEPDMISYFKVMFNNMCDKISMEMKKSAEIDVMKILLQALKTLLKKMISEKKNDESDISQLKDFLKIHTLLSNYMESNAGHEILKTELRKCPDAFVSHVHAAVSWRISLNYLIFLLECYVNEVSSKFSSLYLPTNSGINFEDLICTDLVKTLSSLNSPFLKSNDNLMLLCKILQFGFQGSSDVAAYFLSDLAIAERNDILVILEENCHAIPLPIVYSLMLDDIESTKSQETKLKLLKIFYKLLQGNEIGMHNTVLECILSKFGLTEIFQLPNFDEQLSQFERKTPTLKEAEASLPALFIQNPLTVLKFLIDQALVQGSEGKLFIQFLKHFPQVCLYMRNCNSTCSLESVLNEYFEKKKLESYESKNMVTLYQFLMEVHLETPILFPCSFFRGCIVPKLRLDYDKIELILECSYVLLPALLSDSCFLTDSESLKYFIASFGMLAHHFIITGNGKMKSLITQVLKEFETHQLKSQHIKDKGKMELWSTFKDLSEVSCAYVKEFLPRDIEFVSKSYIWTWCCKNEDSSFFEEKFSIETLTYISLINTLVEVLPHLTKEEWIYSANLVKICCKNPKLREEIVCSNNPFQLSGSKLDTYAAILCIVTSLHFILNDNVSGSLHVSSCFSNSLINLSNQEETAHTHMLLSVFLEMSYFVSSISPDLVPIYNSTLLELQKQIVASCSDEADENDCKKLLAAALVCLPDSSSKKFVFQKV